MYVYTIKFLHRCLCVWKYQIIKNTMMYRRIWNFNFKNNFVKTTIEGVNKNFK